MQAEDRDVVLTDDAAPFRARYRQRVNLSPRLRSWWFEAAIVAGITGGVVEILVSADTYEGYDRGSKPVTAALFALAVGCLLFRRWRPFEAPLASLVCFGVLVGVEPIAAPAYFGPFVSLLVITLLIGAQDDIRRGAVGALAIVLVLAIGVGRDPTSGGGDFFFISFFFGLAWLGGYLFRRRSLEAKQAREVAQRLERDQEANAREAIAVERQRIARELHDVIAHSVSVMTVQAGAVRRLLQPEQEREREALLQVEATGRQALTEMRRLVGLLKEDSVMPLYAPQPSMKTLDVLVGTVREAGLPVELAVEGDQRELAPGVDLAAYRVVQEALTNALKYAGPAHAWVTVRWQSDQLELQVENDGRADTNGQSGGGHGLVGMRERVGVVGGTLESGPREGGGYVVRARIPIGGAA